MERLKSYLIASLQQDLEANPPPPDQRREAILQRLNEFYERTRLQLPDGVRMQIFREVTDEMVGYGPIQPLLDDPEISEVMVNGPNHVYIERSGKLTKTNIMFEDDKHVLRIIEKIVLPLGRHIDEDSPTVDARLPDGYTARID
jgi:pilus assembly protein CpaF